MLEMINDHLSLSFTERKSYSIVTPFEPNDFLSEPWPRITLHTGGQCVKKIVNSQISKGMPMLKGKWKKIKKKYKMWNHSTKSRNVQRKAKCWEVQKKNHQEKKIWREIKVKIKIFHMTINYPWSDHLKTRFWAYLSSSCINLNLAYVTYFESPFGSNVGTWAKDFLP